MPDNFDGNPIPSPIPVTVAGGTDGTNIQALRLTSDGDVKIGAGTAAIGKLAANSGVDIGDVDVTSVLPGVGATNLGKAEDGAHTSGDVGVMALGVRNDNGATSYAGADQDYSPFAVDVKGRTLVTGQRDNDATLGSNDEKPVAIGGRASTATPTAVSDDGDAVWLWLTRRGEVKTTLTDGSGNGITTVGADGLSGSNLLGFGPMQMNAAGTFDRVRGNLSGTAIAQTADSIATVTGSDLTNHNGRSLRLILNFTDKQGTVTFTPKVQGKTSGGTYYDIWTAAAAVSANGVVVYDISPYAASTATGITESKIAPVPRTFRVVLTYSGAGAGNSFDILGEYELGV